MGLKHAIFTLVRRDASPAHETKAGPAAKSNESFKSIRNFVYVFVHRNDSTAGDENDIEQDALTQRDLRRFPGGYQIGEHRLDQIGEPQVPLQQQGMTAIFIRHIMNCGDDDEPRPVSQPEASGSALGQGRKVKEKYLWEVPEDEYELHEVGLRPRDRKKPISW